MKSTNMPARPETGTLTVTRKGKFLTAALEKVPAEAVVTIVNLVADVIRANKTMDGRAQQFEHTITLLREGNMDRKERMSTLANLLRELDLTEDAQMKLVESICKIAEGT